MAELAAVGLDESGKATGTARTSCWSARKSAPEAERAERRGLKANALACDTRASPRRSVAGQAAATASSTLVASRVACGLPLARSTDWRLHHR